MKNVLVSIFSEESKTFEALSTLKTEQENFNVLAAGIIKNNQGTLEIKDGFTFSGSDENWAAGGLIGGLIGILGGPVGILLGSGLGMTVGSGFDLAELDDTQSVLKEVGESIQGSKLALISIAEETDTKKLDTFFNELSANSLIRKSFVDVQAEIYQNQEIEKKLAEEAKQQMRKEKKAKWRAMAEAKQQEFAAKLTTLHHHTKS